MSEKNGSNTSLGHGKKGSKYWIDILVNYKNGELLSSAIYSADNTFSDIKWLSPLYNEEYREYKLNQDAIKSLLGLADFDFSFWPSNQPQWDAIGIYNDTIILVEAKGHTSETKTKLSAIDDKSINLIEGSINSTMKKLKNSGKSTKSNFDVWKNKYYQLANRIVFLNKLNEKGIKTKLVLVNFVNDYTNKPTSISEWEEHYNNVCKEMFDNAQFPDNIINLYYWVK